MDDCDDYVVICFPLCYEKRCLCNKTEKNKTKLPINNDKIKYRITDRIVCQFFMFSKCKIHDNSVDS